VSPAVFGVRLLTGLFEYEPSIMESQVVRRKERRSSQRVPVVLDAVLYYNTLMLPECRVRNLSAEGAFVFTGGQFIPDQASVDLAITNPNSGTYQRLSAVVTHANEQGVGVRLRDVNPAALRSLVETLYTV